ncbi:SsgA family sporulation/cell division regulator [Streptomyces sp. NPDC048566]|uniref:SsgA family sporulation/cell division regulator n=1 Tax=Streptomyces sp. NPDC048566 TaxID=3365569 RepID=UPI003716E683
MSRLVDAEVLMDFLELDEPPWRVPVRLKYRSCDPLAVELMFRLPGQDPVSWFLGRDLLLAGLDRACGEGDVLVVPETGEPESVLIRIQVRGHHALFRSGVEPLRVFLDRTALVVPFGGEEQHPCFLLHLDAELRKIATTLQ